MSIRESLPYKFHPLVEIYTYTRVDSGAPDDVFTSISGETFKRLVYIDAALSFRVGQNDRHWPFPESLSEHFLRPFQILLYLLACRNIPRNLGCANDSAAQIPHRRNG